MSEIDGAATPVNVVQIVCGGELKTAPYYMPTVKTRSIDYTKKPRKTYK